MTPRWEWMEVIQKMGSEYKIISICWRNSPKLSRQNLVTIHMKHYMEEWKIKCTNTKWEITKELEGLGEKGMWELEYDSMQIWAKQLNLLKDKSHMRCIITGVSNATGNYSALQCIGEEPSSALDLAVGNCFLKSNKNIRHLETMAYQKHLV